MSPVFSVAPWLILLLLVALFWHKAIRAMERANEADWGGRWLNRIDGLNRLFCRRFHRLGGEPLPLPLRGAALLVSNHLSGLDPLLLIAASRRPLRFIIAVEQYERFPFKWLFRAIGCIPVDRHGRPERAFREALKALRAGEVVALFPHGAIHLPSDPPRRLKPGVARLAHFAGIPVHCARIEGVRGEGKVIAAVALRSHVRVIGLPPVPCHEMAGTDCLVRLAALIDPHREEAFPPA